MCSRATCPTCHRPTFRGCGQHVEQVLGDVAPDDRCHCSSGGAPQGASIFASLRQALRSR